MFEEYKFIIIGVGAVVVLGIIAMVMMKSKKTSEPKEEESQETKKTANDEKAKIIEEAKQARIDEARNNRLQEEAKQAQEEVKEEKKEEISLVSARPQRDVPAHDKIVKEDFEIFAGMRILVAEDNLINQKVIKGLLGNSGIELVMADDGQIALDILAKDSNFTLVLMDAHMPNIDGFEASRQIRANKNYDNIVIAALSGDTAADDIRKMINAGMQEQLEKPLRLDALYDVLYRYADNVDGSSSSSSASEVQQEEQVEVAKTSNVLDTEKGVATCGGDKDFYIELLNEFASSYETSKSQIEKSLQENDLAGADKLLHEIVGVSGNIGATTLHQHITLMREAIKAGDGAKALTLVEKYEDLLMQVLEEIVDFQ